MRSKKLTISFCLVVVLALILALILPCVFTDTSANDVAYAATSVSNSTSDWTTQYTGTYYNNINANATGTSLRSQVAKLITDTHHTQTTYAGLANAFKTADADPNKSGNIIWFYTGTSVPFSAFGGSVGDTNREHVWPKDGGNAFSASSGPGSDSHHLRPTETNLNSIRGDKSFDEVPQTTSNIVTQNKTSNYDNLCYSSGNFFYPGKGYRGATARILFYMQTRWGDANNLTFVDSAGSCKTIGKISTLMKWHLEEPPTDEEIRRNEAVFNIQGNRNPFIDHPEYAAQIYCNDGQSYNNALKLVVAQYGNYNDDRPELENLTLNNTAFTLKVEQTKTLSVTATPSTANATVTWSTSNANVATVNNGVVTAKSNGTAIITATSTVNTNIKATATVTVKGATAIELIGEPNKMFYDVGQVFDPTGITVKLIYSDDSYETYSTSSELTKFTWVDADTGQPTISRSTTKIKCKYGAVEQTSSWSITIKAATGIELVGNPTKLVYEVGDSFDPTGLTVRVHYNDGTNKDFTTANELRQFVWADSESGNTLLSNNTTITCKYGELTATSSWSIIIKAATSIELVGNPTKLVYEVGDSFDPTGLTVRVYYNDDTHKDFTTANELRELFTWADSSTDSPALDKDTTIVCKLGDLSVVSIWTIEMKKVISIELIGKPNVLAYFEGQSFNPTGLTVRLIYNDTSIRDYVTADELEIFDWVDVDTDKSDLKETTTKIKVKYNELSKIGDFTVTVIVPPDLITPFVNSVNALGNATTLNDRFDAIKLALEKYAELSDDDKEDSVTKAAYLKLLNNISDYNRIVANENSTITEATKLGAYAICGTMLAAAALVAILRRKFN